MKTSHFAAIHLIVTDDDYKPGDSGQEAILRTVGLAQNLRISDNFGSQAVNVIGNPLPVLAAGYMTSNISIDKATIDGASFRSAGMNPLFAHIGKTYRDESIVSLDDVSGIMGESDSISSGAGNEGTYPFLFILSVMDKVSQSYSSTHVNTDNLSVKKHGGTPRTNPIGTYVCILQSADISMSSQQAIILDSVQAIARPITGTWLTKTIRNELARQGETGMRDTVNSVLFGYRA